MKPLITACFLIMLGHAAAPGSGLPRITRYDLRYGVDPSGRTLSCTASMTVLNTTGSECTRIPFLLYRLLDVTAAAGQGGSALPFEQDIVPFSDERNLQVNRVLVQPASPLKSGDSTVITLTFGGSIFGYPEVMAYVRDRIDEEYTLLRPDAFAYPALAEASFGSLHGGMDALFTYDITVDVPPGYVVACGGSAVESRADSGRSVFRFRSMVPTWRIDAGIAKFLLMPDSANRLMVYYLPGDERGAASVLSAARRVVDFYSDEFGRPPDYQGYTVIEIPDGWGSQASDFYFLQTAAAFTDSTKIPEVYHEIGHTWNPRPAAAVQRCRYFDEAFASFYEALAVRRFEGERAFLGRMERSRAIFSRGAERDTLAYATPISGYGAIEYGRYSYSKGAWSLYVLRETVGEQSFRNIIRDLLKGGDREGDGVDFERFRMTAESVSGRDLSKFFDDWIFGAESSRLLTGKVPIADIVERYRAPGSSGQ